ncbi:MAG: 6-carboxytetrahydropterin synthase [Panacagrimonas sp.]
MSKPAPIVELTRRETFAAAHRLWAPDLSAEENWDLYGPCTHRYGHGHNYVLEVTLRGPVDARTGLLMNLSQVSRLMDDLILSDVDHRHLNHDSKLLEGLNPTAENLAVVFWEVLQQHFGALLHEICLRETDKNSVRYRGERT